MAGSASTEHLVELMRRAVAGDDAALENLLIRLHVPTLRFLRRRLGSDPREAEVADDLTQETLVRVYRFLSTCSATNDAQIMAWVLAIARRQLIDWIRAKYRDVAASLALMGDEKQQSEIGEPQYGCRVQQDGSFEHQRLLMLLMDLHDRLPAATQKLLWLRVVQAASWTEVAKEMQTTASAAKRRYQRVQQRLRSELLCRIDELPEGERVRVLARVRVGDVES